MWEGVQLVSIDVPIIADISLVSVYWYIYIPNYCMFKLIMNHNDNLQIFQIHCNAIFLNNMLIFFHIIILFYNFTIYNHWNYSLTYPLHFLGAESVIECQSPVLCESTRKRYASSPNNFQCTIPQSSFDTTWIQQGKPLVVCKFDVS